ncbi:MAG: hypothetical protein V1782_06325 [Pseudomonadota bacterium]
MFYLKQKRCQHNKENISHGGSKLDWGILTMESVLLSTGNPISPETNRQYPDKPAIFMPNNDYETLSDNLVSSWTND